MSQQRHDESQVESGESQRNEDNWQNFDQNFGDFGKLKSMTELGKKLENFALMVQGKQCVIPDLRRELHEIRNIKPESVKSLVDLTKTNEILVTERILNDAHRNAILIDILTTRKTLSEEIVAEGGKCSLVADYAQMVNLYQAWSVIRAAKLTKNESKDEVDKIETTVNEAKTICGQTKSFMTQYTASNDPQEKITILVQLKVKSQEIHELYEKCCTMIQKIDELQIGDKIVKLKFLNFEQKEAKELNSKRVRDKIGLESICNPFKLLTPVFYGTVELINWANSKSIEAIHEKLNEIFQKKDDLEQYTNEIKKVIEEVQAFLDSNQ